MAKKPIDPNKAVSRFRSLVYASAILGIIAAILFTIIYFISFDTDVRYFIYTGSVILAFAFVIGAVVVCAVAALMLPKMAMPMPDVASGKRYASVFAIAGMCTHLVALGVMYAEIAQHKSTRPAAGVTAGVIIVLCAIGYYVLTLIGNTNYYTILIGFSTFLQPILIIAETYFDPKVEMNSHEKVSIELAMAAILLFTTVEFRFMLNRTMPRMAVALIGISFIICCYSFIPNTIAHFTGYISYSDNYNEELFYRLYNLVGLFLTCYIGWRMIDLVRSIKYVPETTPAEPAEMDGGNF